MVCALLLALAAGCRVSSDCTMLDPGCGISGMLLFLKVNGPRFLYVANNQAGGTALTFKADVNTGLLSTIGSGSISSGITPRNVAYDSLARFVWITTSAGGANLNAYRMDQTTGVLSFIMQTGLGGGLPWAIASTPAGGTVYLTNDSGTTVIPFAINQTTGQLTQLTAPATSANPRAAAVDTSGQFLFVGGNTNNINRFRIQTDGSLTSLGSTTMTGGSQSTSLSVSSSNILYATNGPFTRVEPFRIESDGSLTALATTATGSIPQYGQVVGRFFYCINDAAMTISAHSINGDGTLAAAVTTSVSAPLSISVDPSGRFAYVISTANVAVYSLSSSGAATLLANYPQAGLSLLGPSAVGFYDWIR